MIGDHVKVTPFQGREGDEITLRFDAPRSIHIVRQELRDSDAPLQPVAAILNPENPTAMGLLLLKRKFNQSVMVGPVEVKFLHREKSTVRIGIAANTEIPVHRQEIYDDIQRGKQTITAAVAVTNPQPAAGAAPAVQ